MMRRSLRWARSGLAAAALIAASPAAADPHGWDQASNIGRDALVVAALGVPAVQGDWAGSLQAGGSILVAGGATYGLKRLFPEERPDQSDRQSFPSGHTAVSFAAAASLENRYGWKTGLPAFAVAAFVGVARVQARKHRWDDVLAGAVLGTASGLLMTSKNNSQVQFVPWADTGGGGIALAARF